MKYLITEDRLYQIVYKYLDNKNFYTQRVKYNPTNSETIKSSKIYFSDSEDSSHAEIVFDKWHNKFYVTTELSKEVASFFGMSDPEEAAYVISDWVENIVGEKIESWHIFMYYRESIMGDQIFETPKQ
jgi:hypothetical protein